MMIANLTDPPLRGMLIRMSPWAPLRPCTWPACLSLAIVGDSRCPQHVELRRRTRRADDHARRRLDAFYQSRAWRALRVRVLREQPLCSRPGCATPSSDVAHVIPRRARPDLALDRDNVRGLCHACHSAETARRESWHRQ